MNCIKPDQGEGGLGWKESGLHRSKRRLQPGKAERGLPRLRRAADSRAGGEEKPQD